MNFMDPKCNEHRAIMSFLVSHTCDVRFHDVVCRNSVHMNPPAKNSKTWLTYTLRAGQLS